MAIFIIVFISLCIWYTIGRIHGVNIFLEEESEKIDMIIQEIFLKK